MNYGFRTKRLRTRSNSVRIKSVFLKTREWLYSFFVLCAFHFLNVESISTGRCQVASLIYIIFFFIHYFISHICQCSFSVSLPFFSLSALDSFEVSAKCALWQRLGYTNMRTSCTIHIVSKVNERTKRIEAQVHWLHTKTKEKMKQKTWISVFRFS